MTRTSVTNTLSSLLVATAMLLTGGCGGGDEDARSEMAAEGQTWREKYEGLVNENEKYYEKVAALRTEKEAIQKERDKLVKGVSNSPEVKKLKEELAAAEQRASDLEKQLDQASQPAEGGQPADEWRLKMEDARDQLTGIARTLLERQEYLTARDAFLAAIRLGDKEAQTFWQLAACEIGTGNYQAACPWYERALDALEKQSESDESLLKKCLNNYGVALHQLGRPEQASRFYQKVLAIDDTYAPAYFNLGLACAQSLLKPAEAIEAFRKHVIYGGERSASARQFIADLQAGQ